MKRAIKREKNLEFPNQVGAIVKGHGLNGTEYADQARAAGFDVVEHADYLAINAKSTPAKK